MFSSKILGILAIVTTVCFLVLIGLQAGEMMSYSSDPSLWLAP
ncbi:MAG: hypothetical protein V2A34_07330 [Lentisphaerota bacterium]